MSSSALLPGDGGAPQGISDVVSQDDLTRWAQIAGVLRYLTAPLDPPPAPDTAAPISPTLTSSAYRNTAAALTAAGVETGPAVINAAAYAANAGNVGGWTAFFVWLVTQAALPILKFVLQVVDGVRKGIDPGVGTLAVTVMNEFLGTDFTVGNLPLGLGTGDHLARAQSTGQLLYNQLEKEFTAAGNGQVVPSVAPAQTFSGLAVNFGLANGIMGLIGGMVPEVHLEELRELGEEVAQNVGLGRLVRRALTPLITTLVSNPAQWAINTKYLPAQFTEAMLVNPFLATQLDPTQLYNAMHLLGYANDKIEAFIKMHQKRLAPAHVKLLLDHGQWTEQQAEEYMKTLGWPAELQPTALLVEELLEERTWIARLVDEIEAEVKAGRVTIDEFSNVLQGLPYSQPTKDIILATAQYKVKAGAGGHHWQLSEGELQEAFVAGLLTDSQIREYWTQHGLSETDQDIRMLLLLLRLQHVKDVAQARERAYELKLAYRRQKDAGQKPAPPLPQPPIPPFPLG